MAVHRSTEFSEPAQESRGVARARSNVFLAAYRAVLLVAVTIFSETCWLFDRWKAGSREQLFASCMWWTQYWCSLGARIMGITVHVRGELPNAGTFIAPNHLGYMDIVALASVVPSIYVAKADVTSWPVIGFMFRTSEHVGVSRGAGRGVAEARSRVAERLASGASVCVFLEGTSSGGDAVGRFHGSLLQAALDRGCPVVPVGLSWRIDMPGGEVAEDVAYWKDHHFARHIWRLLGLRGVSVTAHFGEPMWFPADADRKAAAEQVRERVVALCESGTAA